MSNYAHRLKLNHAKPSPRDMQVLRLIALGYTNPMIAAELHLCKSAICEHITVLMRRHQLNNRAQLAVQAVKRGAIVVEVEA